MGHSHEIRAAQNRAHHRRQCAGRGENAIADNRLGGLSRASQQDKFGVEPILFIDLGILGDPGDPLRR